ELLSIYPTLIELCGLPAREDLEGISLKPLLANPDKERSHAALRTFGKENHAVRSETHRYIRYSDGSEELYDLQADPNEWNNLASDKSLANVKAALAKTFPKTNANPAKGLVVKRKRPRSNRRKNAQ
ncbi:MAG: DUF4976 domain-containing protein, partial [Planctomycetaceae bacterium]|nr:DUF4976 domain-containing protein [Planctomycetaceae bacterium]